MLPELTAVLAVLFPGGAKPPHNPGAGLMHHEVVVQRIERVGNAERAHRRRIAHLRRVAHLRRLAYLRSLRPRHAVQLAERFIGTPYVWGGASPGGFDCSGLVQYVYSRVGIHLPRVTWDQARVGFRVALDKLRPGDLIFAYGYDHVVLYVGGGMVVHAPFTGTVVSLAPLSIFPIDEARRVS